MSNFHPTHKHQDVSDEQRRTHSQHIISRSWNKSHEWWNRNFIAWESFFFFGCSFNLEWCYSIMITKILACINAVSDENKEIKVVKNLLDIQNICQGKSHIWILIASHLKFALFHDITVNCLRAAWLHHVLSLSLNVAYFNYMKEFEESPCIYTGFHTNKWSFIPWP